MKKILTLIMLIATIFALTGCGAIQPKIGSGNHNIIKINKIKVEEGNKGESFFVSIKADSEPIEKIATIIERAAIEFKKEGVEYFSISPNFFFTEKIPNGILPYVTDIESLKAFCFPEGGGLEQKCKPLTGTVVKLFIKEENSNLYVKPTWSVEEVLNDQNIKKYSNSFKEEKVTFVN